MRIWERFYNRQLNSPERAREIEERERKDHAQYLMVNHAQVIKRLCDAQVYMGIEFTPWSDCDPEPWSKA